MCLKAFFTCNSKETDAPQQAQIEWDQSKLFWCSKACNSQGQDTFTSSFSYFLRELVLFFSFTFFVILQTASVLSNLWLYPYYEAPQCATVPALPGPTLSKSMSQMSSCSESLSFFFFFLEGSSGGFRRDSSSDLLMSEVERMGDGTRHQEEWGRGARFNIKSDKDVLFIILKHSREQKQKQKWNLWSGRPGGNALSIRQISDTALKTTLEKLTVILMVFMLGSCSSKGLCWGV